MHAPFGSKIMEDDTETRGPGSEDAPESLLPYDLWTENALRGVVASALSHAAAEGLPGQHHFYITFRTDFPGVVIPPRLRAKYPEEMTIVLQHQFENLFVDEVAGLFGVSLSFGGVLSPLSVPLSAVTAFVDPHVQYGLRFRPAKPEVAPAPAAPPTPPAPEVPSDQPQVVSLDAFRRKRD
jgi:hypothetical protein